MALQFSITAIGTIIVQGAINVYGENAMAGFSAASKLQNIIMTVFVAFGATIATYVGQNRGAGENGPRQTGSPLYAVYDLGIQYFCNGTGFLLWKISDLAVYQSVRNCGSQCGSYLFSDGLLVLSIFRKYFPVSEYLAGTWIWSCTDAGRSF